LACLDLVGEKRARSLDRFGKKRKRSFGESFRDYKCGLWEENRAQVGDDGKWGQKDSKKIVRNLGI
jgi:hypothetical protein